MMMMFIIMSIAPYISYMHWLCTMRYFSVTDEPTNKAILGVGSRESAAGQHLFCFFYKLPLTRSDPAADMIECSPKYQKFEQMKEGFLILGRMI